MKNDITLFCTGDGCLLKAQCHRFVDGQRIDKNAAGYSWMASCDIEERNGYMPIKIKHQL